MKHVKRETEVVARGQGIRADGDAALDVVEIEGLPPVVLTNPGRGKFVRKLARYFKGEYAFLTANSDITLDQLYRKLVLADAEDTRARNRFREMMFLMASDLREERQSPLAGSSAGMAKPMSAWRERYNELDRYLGR